MLLSTLYDSANFSHHQQLVLAIFYLFMYVFIDEKTFFIILLCNIVVNINLMAFSQMADETQYTISLWLLKTSVSSVFWSLRHHS